MSEIKSIYIKPKRETFGHVERRIGKGKSATRYQEATYDIQATGNFHYKPLYNSKFELYDKNKTAIKMDDWYKFLDPRQFHYSSYVSTRAKQQEVTEQNFTFIENRGLINLIPQDVKENILTKILPLRHYEWGANLNNLQLVSETYGAALASPFMFHATDRVGNAQNITKNALMISENDTQVLDVAKELWEKDSSWQPLRKAMEDSFVIEDWFELHIAQNVIMDGFLQPLFFDLYEKKLNENTIGTQGMMTEFMRVWFKESKKWLDKIIQVASSESSENSEILSKWAIKYIEIMEEATLTLAKNLFENPDEVVESIKTELIARLNKNGLKV